MLLTVTLGLLVGLGLWAVQKNEPASNLSARNRTIRALPVVNQPHQSQTNLKTMALCD